jgi:hypothetical protein
MMNDGLTRRSLLAGVVAGYFVSNTRLLAQPSDLTTLTIDDARRLIAEKKLSPVELARAYLARFEKINPRINAYITVTGDSTLKQAQALEAEMAKGRSRGPLHGAPIALKDNIDTAGVRTTAASAVFADRVPTEDSVVVRKLRDAGAVFLGKLNMHEFAYGGTSVVSHFGPCVIRGTPTIRRAVPRAGRQLPSRLVCAPPRSVPTRPHPSGCPPRFAVWLASRPHTDSPAFAASFHSPRATITSDRWPAASPTAR